MNKLKDMKVANKIIYGFGSIIGLLIIVAVVVVASNVFAIISIGECSDVSEFQSNASNLLDAYDDSRIAAETLYLSVGDEEYQRVIDGYAVTQELVDAMLIQADNSSLLSTYKDALVKIDANIDSWINELHEVQKYNQDMVKITKELQVLSTFVAENASEAYKSQNAILKKKVSDGAEYAEISKDIDALWIAEKIEVGVMDTRRSAAGFMSSYDVALIGNFNDIVKSTKESFTKFEGAINDRELKAKMTKISQNYTAFTDSISGFVNACELCNVRILRAVELGEVATSELFILLDNLDKEMSDNFATSNKASFGALIMIAIVSFTAIILGILIASAIVKSINVPISKMNKIAGIVAQTGRMQFNADEMAEAKSAISGDEIGQTVLAFCTMMESLVKVAGELEKLSQGDLTIEIRPISKVDTMVNALNNTVNNLNDMFTGIYAVTDQVASGARQVADGAQTLASGSTEQAASIEQLSSSIFEISEATKDTASKASRAAELSDNVKHAAQKGEVEMNSMMTAVREINDASQNISKIISVIDDIAFQTNILALNAAVEAARAGEAGKGFAVVADEVRELASKSAEAAKNTTQMISASIEKAELGSKIAVETASSLKQIVKGVMESTVIIEEIAKLSDEQSMRIEQINIGISQVSDVVQQNSATSEESAAAAEEMNGQTVVLTELIDQFKLK